MRNISFSLTEPQILAQTKDVTRRLGWKNLWPGDLLQGCRKCMGRKPGEPLVKLAVVIVHSISFERLDAITQREVEREGFPDWTPAQFVAFFCESHKGCTPETIVTRISFRYAQPNGTTQQTAGETRPEAAERQATSPAVGLDVPGRQAGDSELDRREPGDRPEMVGWGLDRGDGEGLQRPPTLPDSTKGRCP